MELYSSCSVKDIYETRLHKQFVNGVFDLDGLALLLSILNIENCYISGGAEDFQLLLQYAFNVGLSRLQIISRDYEPHFLVCDIIFCNKVMREKYKREIIAVIIDSTPCKEQGKRVATKYHTLLQNIFPNNSIRIYTNCEQLQYDDYSCKMFAINATRRLSRYTACELCDYCHEYSKHTNDDIIYFPPYSLPAKFVYDVQSYSYIEKYIKNNKGEETARVKLEKYINKHSVNVEWKGQTKKQNHSILHKLTKYRNMVEKYIILPDNQCKSFNPIFLSLLGFDLYCNNMRDISATINRFSTPDQLREMSSFPSLYILYPLLLYLPLSSEEAYPQRLTNFLHKKPPEDDFEVTKIWDIYKEHIRRRSPLNQTWLSEYGIGDNYIITDEYVIVNKNVITQKIAKEIQRDILTETYKFLDKGCGQPLKAFILTLEILQD